MKYLIAASNADKTLSLRKTNVKDLQNKYTYFKWNKQYNPLWFVIWMKQHLRITWVTWKCSGITWANELVQKTLNIRDWALTRTKSILTRKLRILLYCGPLNIVKLIREFEADL